MKKYSNKYIALVGLFTFLALVLYVWQRTEANPAPVRKEKDTFRIGVMELGMNMKPYYPTIHSYANHVFDTLKSFPAAQTSKKKYPNIAAERIEISDDGKECLISLRKGMLFHNGEEVTSSDVVYSIEAIWKNGTTYQAGLEFEIVDRYTLRIKGPAQIDWDLVMQTSIVSEKNERKYADIEDEYMPVGSGPYKVVSFDYNTNKETNKEIIKLERWDKYWAGPAKYKYVEIHRMSNADTQTMALLEGKIDHAKYLSFEDMSIIRKNKELKVLDFVDSEYGALLPNPKKPMLADRRVRKALSLLIDREMIVASENGLNGAGRATDTIFNHTKPYTAPEVVDGYNPRRAMELFAEAGCKRVKHQLLCKGKPLSIQISVFTDNTVNTSGPARFVARAWNEAGIATSIRTRNQLSTLKLIEEGNFDVLFSMGIDHESLMIESGFFLDCEDKKYCIGDPDINPYILELARLNERNASDNEKLAIKRIIQKRIRDVALEIPLYYVRSYVAIRGEDNFTESFKMDPKNLSYQARPSLVR
ncbi:MAG: ABC transporter substrate-binding protein [Nitrospinota bacterium]|nr:ABC transporter substrate-binding protein [Nitrospinota bacterium]